MYMGNILITRQSGHVSNWSPVCALFTTGFFSMPWITNADTYHRIMLCCPLQMSARGSLSLTSHRNGSHSNTYSHRLCCIWGVIQAGFLPGSSSLLCPTVCWLNGCQRRDEGTSLGYEGDLSEASADRLGLGVKQDPWVFPSPCSDQVTIVAFNGLTARTHIYLTIYPEASLLYEKQILKHYYKTSES